MFLKLLTDFHAGQIAVIFDAKRANFRNDIYAAYKANRSDAPDELIPQFPIIREAVAAFSLPSLELEGYEADDLIATYACLARARGQEVTIVSSDKDLMQLVRDGVDMFDPIKNKTIGRDEVMEKFGVPPEKMIEVQALIGDSIDNVPGVPGIGPKTAAQLIGEFGDLETLLAQAHTIKQDKRRETILANADQARLSKRLVTLDCNVPVPAALEDLVVHPLDLEKLGAFCREQGFKSILARLEVKGLEAPAPGPEAEILLEPAEIPPPSPLQIRYELVNELHTLDRWIAKAREAGFVAFSTLVDYDCACAANLVGLSLAVAPGIACYIPFCHIAASASPDGTLALDGAPAPKQIALPVAMERLKPLFADKTVLKIGHNLKAAYQVLGASGLVITPFDDTMLLSYTLDGTSHGHGLQELAEMFLSHTTMPYGEVTGTGKAKLSIERVEPEKAMAYAAEEADMILRLHDLFKKRLSPERMTTLYETIERPLVPVVAAMEQHGIKVDLAALKGLSLRFQTRLAELEGDIQRRAGREFNIGSPKQLGEILFNELKIQGGRKTKTGDWSTDSAILEPLAESGHDIVGKVLEWRQTAKLKNTYTDAPAGRNPAAHRTGAHDLPVSRDKYRTAILYRAQPAEHPDPDGGGPRNPPRLHRGGRVQAGVGRLLADRAQAGGGDRGHHRAGRGRVRGACDRPARSYRWQCG